MRTSGSALLAGILLACAAPSPSPASDLPDGITRRDEAAVRRMLVDHGHAGLRPVLLSKSERGWVCGGFRPADEDAFIPLDSFAANPRTGKLVILWDRDVHRGSPNLLFVNDNCKDFEITID